MTLHPANKGTQTPEEFASKMRAAGYVLDQNGTTWVSASLVKAIATIKLKSV